MSGTLKIMDKKQTLVIAHRGLCGIEPENTNAAFIAAGNRSYWGIESDVHKTADGRYVMMHDETTLRMTGEDIEIKKTSYETLRQMSLYQKDGRKGRTDLRIPSLEEYISICKCYEKMAILELKADFTAEDVDEICKIIEEMEYMEHTLFISFKWENLLLLKNRNPKHPAQYLVEKKIDDDFIQEMKKHGMGIDARKDLFTEEIIRKCRENGVATNAWTVNKLEDAQKLIDWGIDYITTNIVE